MMKIIRLVVGLLLAFTLCYTQPAFAKSNHHSSSASQKSSATHPTSTKKKSSSTSQKQGNCDYPWQTDSAGRSCGNRAASVRPGGRLN
jgi:cytoskeletal protein RodZ